MGAVLATRQAPGDHLPEAIDPTMAIMAGMGRVTSEVFVGRRDEIARVEAAVAAARAGTPAIMFVAGEAGVGKTRFVDEAVANARAAGATVLVGGCIDLGGEPLPFAPIVEALRRLRRELPPDVADAILGPARNELGRLLPELEDAPSGGAAGVVYTTAQARLFELLLGVLVRLVRPDAPAVVIVEDIHWADRSTLDLLSFLTRNLYGGIVLVATYRTDELHRRHPLLPFLAEATRSGRVERIELQRFDRTELVAQLDGILGHAPDGELVDRIFERSGGNAFFTEELLASGHAGDELPETLRDVLLARIAELSEPAQELLRVAAAAGREVSFQLLEAVMELPRRELEDALREGVARQILVPRLDGANERYGFRHALAQEAIYADLLPGERTRLHLACAQVLSVDPRAADDPALAAELARHWYAAHDLPRALVASVRAGMAAQAAFAFAEAVTEYERALELWTQVPDAERDLPLDRVALLERAAETGYLSGRLRAVEHIKAAIAMVDEHANPARAGLLYERLGRYNYVDGNGQLAVDAYRKAVALVPPEPPSAARARTLAGLGQILMLTGDFEESSALCREAIEIARTVDAPAIEGHALNTLGVDLGSMGDVDGGVANLRQALELARSMQTYEDVGRAYNNLADLLNTVGRAREAEQIARQGYEEFEDLNFIRFAGGHFFVVLIDSLLWQGRWDEAEEVVRRAEALATREVLRVSIPAARLALATARGEYAAAHASLEGMRRAAARVVDPQYIVMIATLEAELNLWEGRPAAALAAIVDARERMDMRRLHAIFVGDLAMDGIRAAADVVLSATSAATPRGGAGSAATPRGSAAPSAATAPRAAEAEACATTMLEEVRNVAERAHGSGHELAVGLARALAEGEWARLQRRPAVEPWVEARRLAGEMANAALEGYAAWREAEALLATRAGRAEASAALRRAAGIARRIAMVPLVREVEGLARQARIDLTGAEWEFAGTSAAGGNGDGSGTPDRPDETAGTAERLGLTARELEVLRLVADGQTNREIGQTLYISDKTAGVHVSNILAKLGVSGRREAAAVARRLGLVDEVPV